MADFPGGKLVQESLVDAISPWGLFVLALRLCVLQIPGSPPSVESLDRGQV